MGKSIQRISLIGGVIGFAALMAVAPVSAHVTVRPAEVKTASYQTFTINVPNEREVSTVGVKVLIPQGVQGATPTQKAGWGIAIEKEGDGPVTALAWSGGEITDGTRDEFSFSAKIPEDETELQWKAYQTYADGVVVSWDQDSEGGHGDGVAGPFSVTKVVAESAQDKAIADAQVAGMNAQATTRLALYASMAAVVLGLIGIYLGARKTKQ